MNAVRYMNLVIVSSLIFNLFAGIAERRIDLYIT